MGVHYIERHLHSVECETVLVGRREHVKVNLGTLMASEADVSKLASPFRLEHCLDSASAGENSIRVVHPNHFMKLHQVNSVSLQAPQRFVDLPGGRGFVASVDLRHHKCFAPVAIAQGFSDPRLALAVVVVPTVVEKIDAVIQSGSHDSDAFGFLYQGASK